MQNESIDADTSCRIVKSAPKMYTERYWNLLKPEEKDFFSSSFHDCTVTSCRKRGEDLIVSFDNSGGFYEY